MLFSTVYFPEEIEDVENKLRLNLSDHAFSVLNYDIEAFGIGDANDSRIPSSFINNVFSVLKMRQHPLFRWRLPKEEKSF